ncbi:MAG: hypothetical protein KC553_11760 [Nitrospina sp.]|nr:hypothetical protein [Nitrospina sp.]
MRRLGFVLFALSVFCWCAAPAWSKNSAIGKTGDKAWDAFIVLQTDWTQELHDLVLKEKKEFQEIADLSYEWRLAEMKLDTLKFQYLKKNRPETIERDKGLPAFVTLAWFPDYSEKLEKADPAFHKQENKAAGLKQKVEAHKDWQGLQDYLSSLQKDEKHKKRFDDFLEEMNAVQKILAQTAADQERQRH